MNEEEIKKQILDDVEADPICQPFSNYINNNTINDACFLTELNSIVIKKFYNQIVPLNLVHGKEQPRVQYFEENSEGIDYIVGDIHNQFELLEKQLLEINFDKLKDRLFTVGDLVDRGRGCDNDGFLATDYLKKKWFKSVMGNHEDMVLSILSLPKNWNEIAYKLGFGNGSSWLLSRDTKIGNALYQYWHNEHYMFKQTLNFEKLMDTFPKVYELYFELSRLPYIIQLGQNIGIVHAEVPLFIKSWQELLEKVEEQHIDTLESLIWGRMRIELDINKEVNGIKRIYSGHTPIAEVDNYANHRCIDIGAYKNKARRLHIERINYE